MKAKKIVSLLTGLAVTLSCVTVLADVKSDTVNSTPATKYVYEDFNTMNDGGSSAAFKRYGIGYLTEAGSEAPYGFFVSSPTYQAIGWLGEEGNGYYGFKHAKRADGTNARLFASDVHAQYNTRNNQRLYVDWMNFDGIFNVSYDFLTPTYNIDAWATPGYLMLGGCYMVQLPEVKVSGNKLTAISHNSPWTDKMASGIGTAEVELEGVKPGDWVNISVSIQKFQTGENAGRYIVYNYINGTFLGTCGLIPQEQANSFDGKYLANPSSVTDTGFSLFINGMSNGQSWLGIDNLSYKLYSEGTTVSSYGTVDGQDATVKVYNTQLLNDPEADDIPEYSKRGLVDATGATFTAKKYSAEDKMLLGRGEPIGVTRAVRYVGERLVQFPTMEFPANKFDWAYNGTMDQKNIPHDTAIRKISNDGSQIQMKLEEALGEGERAVVEITGLKNEIGEEMPPQTVILCNEGEDAAILDYGFIGHFNDLDGNPEVIDKSVLKYDADTNKVLNWPVEMKKMTFSVAEDGLFALCDANNTVVATATGNSKQGYTLDLGTTVLKSNSQYKITHNGSDYIFFDIGGEPIVKFGNYALTGDKKVIARYFNTGDTGKTTYLIAAPMSVDGVRAEKPICEAVTVNAFSSDAITSTKAFARTDTDMQYMTADIAALDAKVSRKHITTDDFDASNKINVTGSLGSDYAGKAVKIIVFNNTTVSNTEANMPSGVEYAKNVKVGEDGNYDAELNFTGFATDEYRIELHTEDGKYYVDKSYGDSVKSGEALETVNSASSLSEMQAALLTDYPVALELDYEYYTPLNDKSKVADFLYDYSAKAKENGTATPFATKQAFAAVYRTASVAQAFNEKKIALIDDVEAIIPEIGLSPVKEWYESRENAASNKVTAETTANWHRDVTARLNNGGIKNIDDLYYKINEALLLAIVDDSTTPVLTAALKDFGEKLSISEDLMTSDVVSKIVGKTYADCATLKADMEKYKNANTKPDKPSGGGGGGGGGGIGSISISSEIVPVPNQPIDTLNPPAQETKYAFDDLSEADWAAEAVKVLKERKIIDGKEANKFCPNDNITREEFTKIIVELFGFENKDDASEFSDVEDGTWYSKYISIASSNGIISGMGDGTFGIGEDITRQDMVVIIMNAIKSKGIEVDAEEAKVFTDTAEIADYAVEVVDLISGLGIIGGYPDGSFGPLNNATRAETAKIIFEVINKLGM